MRHWKIVGAIIALLGEGALQVSGFTSPPLAIFLGLVCVALALWSVMPVLKKFRFQKPIIMSGANQGQEGQIPLAKVSQQENKLALVAKAIMDAKQLTPVGTDTPVYITDSNGLTRIYPQELKGILVKFQNDERVITLKSFPEWLLPIELKDWNTAAVNKQMEVALDPSKNHFVVNVLDTFDKWYKTIIKK